MDGQEGGPERSRKHQGLRGECVGVIEGLRGGPEGRWEWRRNRDREIRWKDAKKDEIGTSLVNLNNYMTWAQGYDLIISKLQFHAFRHSTN